MKLQETIVFKKEDQLPSGEIVCIPKDDYYKMVRALRMFLTGEQQANFENLEIRISDNRVED